MRNRIGAAVRTVARRLPIPPVQALFEPSKVCNLNCDYCRRNESGSVSQSKADGNHFTPAKFEEALDKLNHIWVANWIGDGEPLLNPDFNRLIEITHDRGIKTTFGTNGMLVTRGDVDFWKQHSVSEVSVSLDSPIPEKYEQMRQGARFDRVIESCRMISNAGIKLQLQIILFAESADDMPRYVDLAVDVGAWRIALPRPHLYDSLERYRSSYPDPAKANPPLAVAMDKMKKAHIRWYEPWYATTYFRRCMWPFGAPYIQINGTIQPCCFMSGGDKVDDYDGVAYTVPSMDYVMGNIFTDDFNKIWKGAAYTELRHLLIKSERPVGTTIEPDQLHTLKKYRDGRFSHCYGCSWRWGIEC